MDATQSDSVFDTGAEAQDQEAEPFAASDEGGDQETLRLSSDALADQQPVSGV